MFPAALTVWSNILYSGNNITVDSYDSSDPTHCTNGMYYFPWRKAGGDLQTDLGVIDLGNANINGKVRTGPDGGFTMGPNGFVGDLSWIGPGIQPGWYAKDFQFCLPDIGISSLSGLPPFPGPPGSTNLYIMSNGDYILNGKLSTRNRDNIQIFGKVRLYVTGEVLMQGQSTITIAEGAVLEIYAAGASSVLTSVNTSGNANTFRYFGLPTNTNLIWSGNAQYMGCVYAPQAAFHCGAGGTNIYDYQGAIVAKSVYLNGNFNIHFDEALARRGPMR